MQSLGFDAVTLAYFVAGLVGSLARVLVGTAQQTWSRRTLADVVMGAIGGMVLPWLGIGLGASIGVDAADTAKLPVVVKAGLVALTMYAGSHAFAAILHRRELGKNGAAKLLLVLGLAPFLAGCMGTMPSSLVEGLAKDPATACVSVATPYGSMAFARAVQAGADVTVEAGRCTVKHTAPK